MKRPRKLAVVLSHPTQYYSPWFRWLAAHADISLRVFYLWDFGITRQRDPQFETPIQWDVDLLSGYEWELVPNSARDPGTHHFSGLTNPTLLNRLAKWGPDVILIFGYKWWSLLRVIGYARFRGIPLLFRGDSHFLGRGQPSWFKRAALRLLYAQFSAFLVVGSANGDYFRTLGVPEKKLTFCPHSVDANLFNPTVSDYARRAAQLRVSLNLQQARCVVLFAGKFTAAKQPCELLEAFIAVAPPDAAIVFVGDGPEREKLQRRSAESTAQVRFLPFANQSEMPVRYMLADIFALPSRGHYETWGLAVNEAMHMGLVPLVSDRVGCQRDLVEPDVTGWVFQSDNPDDLRDKLRSALTVDIEPLRQRSAQRIAGYTYAQSTAGLLRALRLLGEETALA